MRLGIFALALMSASAGWAQTMPGISIKVTTTSGAGVQSKILQRMGAATSSIRTRTVS